MTIYGESYPAGTGVSISHTTEEGFYFHGWNLDMAGTPKYETGNPYNLTVNSDINVYPQVALEGAYSIFVDLPNKDYVFDVTSGSAKPINENGYAENTKVTIKSARSGYVIEKWIDFAGNELSTNDPFVLTIDGDKHITPVWTSDPNEVTIEINTSEQCTISGLPEGGKCPKGTLITITAEPAIGYQFSHWEDADGNIISTDNPLVIVATQDENITCYPIFQAEQRTFEIATGVNAQMGTLNKNLPWTKTTTKPGLAYMSTTGHNGQDSRDTLIITPEEGVSYRLSFDYAVSSEKEYDTLSIWVNNVRIAEKISGEESGSHDSGVTLLTELTTIVMSYHKDGSVGRGDDRGYIYNIVVTSDAPQVYTRDVTEGNWGTICLPWESVALEGGTFYDVLGTKDAELGVALVELGESDPLTAGKPYVFKATSEQIKVTYDPTTAVEDSVYDDNLLYGSFEGCTVPEGKYIIYNNLLYITNGSNTIGANRAYFDVDAMGAYNPATAPARVVFFGDRQTPTGIALPSEGKVGKGSTKLLRDGQLIIIRDGKEYNAQGQIIQ